MELNFFVKYVLPVMILVFGLFGNTMGIIVVSRKNLKKIGPVLIYKFLFLSDSVYISMYIFNFIFC